MVWYRTADMVCQLWHGMAGMVHTVWHGIGEGDRRSRLRGCSRKANTPVRARGSFSKLRPPPAPQSPRPCSSHASVSPAGRHLAYLSLPPLLPFLSLPPIIVLALVVIVAILIVCFIFPPVIRSRLPHHFGRRPLVPAPHDVELHKDDGNHDEKDEEGRADDDNGR